MTFEEFIHCFEVIAFGSFSEQAKGLAGSSSSFFFFFLPSLLLLTFLLLLKTCLSLLPAVFRWLDQDGDGFISEEDFTRGYAFNFRLTEDFLTEKLFFLKGIREDYHTKRQVRTLVKDLLSKITPFFVRRYNSSLFSSSSTSASPSSSLDGNIKRKDLKNGGREVVSFSKWMHLALAEPTTKEESEKHNTIVHFVNLRCGGLARWKWKTFEDVTYYQFSPVLLSKDEAETMELRMFSPRFVTWPEL
jgi:hypothetical protein